jgi:formate dehydrogenase alpha subunit
VERVTSSDDNYNRGNLCTNGRFGYAAFNSSGRVVTPLIKDAAGKQVQSSWDQALGTVAAKLKGIVAASGGAAVAGIGSPRVTNEESYLFQKFLRSAVGTNNIDSEARLGYFPAQIIQHEMLGYSGGTFDMNTIETASAVLVIGADLKGESAGFAYRAIQAATKNNAKLVLANVRSTSMNKFANGFLQYRPGSEAWLVAGLNKALLAEGVENRAFVEQGTKGLDALKASLDAITFDRIAEISGITETELRQAARLISSGGRTAVVYGADLMRSADSRNAVAAVVNLALLTGATGEAGAGIYPLDEKNNTQGMLDMGVCPEYLPGYHTYAHKGAAFAEAWNNGKLPTEPGKDVFKIIDGIEAGEIKALYVMGNDPLHFMPDRGRVLKALQKLELLVVQDLFLTDTGRLADVVLPAATAAEKAGSFTAVDNRVQCFPRAVAPAADTRTDADILNQLYSLVAPAAPIARNSQEDLHREISTLTGLYSETCDHTGCRMGRVKNLVASAGQQAEIRALAPTLPPAADPARPFTLFAGPVLHHNGTFSTWSENNLMVAGESYVEMNGADAAKAGFAGGDNVKLSSPLGSIILKARISDVLRAGTLFVPNHFREAQVNLLTADACTAVAVKVEKA